MPKLDGKFYGTLRKAKDDTVVSDDEFVVFLAKDTAFADYALPAYVKACIELDADDRQVKSAAHLLERVQTWRALNPDKIKVPDIAPDEKVRLD